MMFIASGINKVHRWLNLVHIPCTGSSLTKDRIWYLWHWPLGNTGKHSAKNRRNFPSHKHDVQIHVLTVRTYSLMTWKNLRVLKLWPSVLYYRILLYYSFIEIISDIPHKFTIKVQVIRNTVHRPSTQASYTMGSGTTSMQENQQAAQIAAKHCVIPQMAPYMSWIFLVLHGGNRSRGLSPGMRDS